MGTILTEPSTAAVPDLKGVSFPRDFDSRVSFKNCTHPIRNQVGCSSARTPARDGWNRARWGGVAWANGTRSSSSLPSRTPFPASRTPLTLARLSSHNPPSSHHLSYPPPLPPSPLSLAEVRLVLGLLRRGDVGGQRVHPGIGRPQCRLLRAGHPLLRLLHERRLPRRYGEGVVRSIRGGGRKEGKNEAEHNRRGASFLS